MLQTTSPTIKVISGRVIRKAMVDLRCNHLRRLSRPVDPVALKPRASCSAYGAARGAVARLVRTTWSRTA
jgi:hypothetical protein